MQRSDAEKASIKEQIQEARESGYVPSSLEEMVEQLYDLSRADLRSLAWEALLISDGPDKIEGEAITTIKVHHHEDVPAFCITSPKY